MKIGNVIDEMTKKLVDNGKIIEAGWLSMRACAFPEDISKEQEADLRATFFAGAQHLFASIMAVLDPGSEPTERDLVRMKSISDELDAFVAKFKVDMEAKCRT